MIDQHDSLAQKFLKKWVWLYVFSFIVGPIWYIIKIILSGELEVSEMGILYGVMSLMVLLASFNDLGMSESLNKFIPEFVTKKRYDQVKTTLLYAFWAQVVTGGILFLLFFYGAEFLSLHYFKDEASKLIIQVFAFFFLGMTFFHVINIFFQAVQNTFLQKITELFRMLFILGFTLYMYFTGAGNLFTFSLSWVLWLYFGILIALYFFYTKYYKPYLFWVPLDHSPALFKSIFKYALIVFLGSQASTILGQIDMQMIIYMLGNTDAGYYTNYLSLIGIPFIIIGPIFWFLFPVFSELIAKKEYDKITLIRSIFTKNFLAFSVVFSILFFVFAKEIAFILFGPKYEMSGVILQYSTPFLVFNFLLQINFNILAANGKVVQRLHIILIAIVFNTILNFILIQTLWVVGAALATGCGWILIYFLSNRYLKEFSAPFDFTYFFKNISLFAVIWTVLWYFIVPWFSQFNRIEWFFLLAFVWILYFSLYALWNLSDFQYFFSEIKKSRGK